jgi:hypothetical protein
MAALDMQSNHDATALPHHNCAGCATLIVMQPIQPFKKALGLCSILASKNAKSLDCDAAPANCGGPSHD